MKENVYQFRVGDRWIDYRGWKWNLIPRNERRVIKREKRDIAK